MAKYKNLSNQTFGFLTAIRPMNIGQGSKNGLQWLCKCVCGQEVIRRSATLINNKSISCGCKPARTKQNQSLNTEAFVPTGARPLKEVGLNQVYASYKRGARNRGLSFRLTKQHVADLIEQRCSYCGAQPSNTKRLPGKIARTYTYQGIDRIDNNHGYTVNNVAPCCEMCNKAKRDCSQSDFLEWATRIYKYQRSSTYRSS